MDIFITVLLTMEVSSLPSRNMVTSKPYSKNIQ